MNSLANISANIAVRGAIVTFLVLACPTLLWAQPTKIKATEGRYSVIFPAAAERTTIPPKTEDGEQWGFGKGTKITYAIETYKAQLQNEIFMTAYTRYTGEGIRINAEKELKLNRDNFLKGVNGKLTTSADTNYISPSAKKIPGIEFTGESDAWMLFGKFYVDGNDVWGIIYLARKAHQSATVWEQFYRSLEIQP